MNEHIKGKSILITGANRGMGLGFVQTFLEAGAKTVYATVRDRAHEAELKALSPERITVLPLDLCSSESIDEAASQIPALDVLVNNAGAITGVRCGDKESVHAAKDEMQVNLFGPMQLTDALMPKLKQSESGVIVNVASVAALYNCPSIGTYSISKAAMQSYTEGLRADLSESTISVLGVYPGPHDTRLAEGFEMEKPAPENVAVKVIEALNTGIEDIYPDDFSQQMLSMFRSDVDALAAFYQSLG